jgi:aspartate-semialdehyde dehydrogenase
MDRIPVAVLGATGSVGQRFVQLLDQHPWFEVQFLSGSPRSQGRTYRDACRWVLETPMPVWAQELVLQPSDPSRLGVRLAFSALPSRAAREVEPAFARAGVLVCSNASAFRDEPDVPILLPEINPGHSGLLPIQQKGRGWSGAIVTNANCTSTGASIALKALHDAFQVQKVFLVSMQAISGAGYPGVPALDIVDNVIPYIAGEEPKVEWESSKILGILQNGAIQPATFVISAHTNRVAVRDGHLVCLSLGFVKPWTLEAAREALADYQAPAAARDLPSTPRPVIEVRDEPDRPQPYLDRMAGRGMTTVAGRLRPDPLFDLKLVVLSHNTIRGAAGGSIYNAEYLIHQGWLV